MAIKAIDLRRGQAVSFKNGIWACTDNQKIAKGKGQSYQSISLKNVQTGQTQTERFRTNDEFEEIFVDQKVYEYLYTDANGHVLMDTETYEQVPLPKELLGEQEVYLTENIPVEVAFVEGKPILAELPNTVELKVVDTPPQIKGATATNQLKDAVCEGGAKIKVPPFIENGQVVKVDTRSGEYIGKV